MEIFLADTVHNSGQLSPNTVPYNVARIAAYCQSKHPDLNYTLFKDPHRLLARLREAAPDVLALSNYFWNDRLNHRIARFARALRPEMLIVVGGPNLNRDEDAYRAYAAEHPYVDFVIVDEGETCFESVVSALRSAPGASRAELKTSEVPGTFAVAGPGRIRLSRARPRVTSLDEFPSPYLNGMLDPFLEQGMQPIVEFVRGCPYQCAFCEQGSSFFTKLAKLTPARVYEEVEYIRTRTKSPQLIVADVNFGILKRDLEIARFLKAMHLEKNWPARLYVYNAKVPTADTLECIETLNPIAALCMSFQSTNSQVLDNIHRSNIGYDKYSHITKWAKERGIPVGTELIYGLPGETRESFIGGYETLMGFRADYMASYNLRLFAGMELNRPDVRSRYGITTRFRPMDINLGEYVFEMSERLLEVEEIVLSTSTLTEDDFFYTRQIALMVESLWNTGYLRPALVFLAIRGRPVMALFDEMLSSAAADAGASAFFAEYRRLAREELVDDSKAFEGRIKDDGFWNDVLNGRGVNMKLNLAFAGRLLFFKNAVDDFFYRTMGRLGASLAGKDGEAFSDLLTHCRATKVALDDPREKRAELLYDVPAWIAATYPEDIEKFRMPARETFVYSLSSETVSAAMQIKHRMDRKGASLSALAERMMMELPKTDCSSRRALRASAPPLPAGDTTRMADRMSWAE